jgi:hypothetical protein
MLLFENLLYGPEYFLLRIGLQRQAVAQELLYVARHFLGRQLPRTEIGNIFNQLIFKPLVNPGAGGDSPVRLKSFYNFFCLLCFGRRFLPRRNNGSFYNKLNKGSTVLPVAALDLNFPV